MSAAYELDLLGYQVSILEANSSAGGRCRTIRSGDNIEEIDSVQTCNFDTDDSLYFNPGPARIPNHHNLLLGYCREFGVALEPFINSNYATLFHSQTAFNGSPQVARQIIADTRGYISQLLAEATQNNTLSINLSASERANLTSLLQQFGDIGNSLIYSSTSRAGFPGHENANSRDRGSLLNQNSLNDLLSSNFWQSQLSFAEQLDQQASMLQPVGGMDNIARAFEQKVQQLCIFDAEVREIRKTSTGVSIAYRDDMQNSFSVTADYCICTIPATVVKNISNDFSVQHQAALDGFVYAQAAKVAFQSERFWEQDQSIYGGISWTDQDITQLWYPSHGLGQSQGILVGAYTFSPQAGSLFTNQSPSTRLDTAITQGAQLHSQYAAQVANGISISWPKVPYQLGAWGQSDPGILTTADANIYFAGEHLSSLQGWQEGAIVSAYNAIDKIVTRDS
jgi:monoamine oxidase